MTFRFKIENRNVGTNMVVSQKLCTSGFAEGTHARENSIIIWFSSHLFVPLHQKSVSVTHEDEERESKTSDTVAGGSLPREDP